MDKTSSNKKPPLFMPEVEPYRLKYKDTDRARAFRRQPLKNIPGYLTYKSSDTRSYLPPVMHLGWILDRDRALSFVQSHGINPVADLGDGPVPNYYLACEEALDILLDEERLVPHDARIKVTFFNDGQYVPNPVELGKCNFHLALSVGTNYSGAIPMEHIEKLGKVVASGSSPKWFLDMDEWFWTKKKSSKPSSSNLRKRARAGSDTASDTTVHATADSRKRDKSRNKKPRVLPATDVESMVIDPIS